MRIIYPCHNCKKRSPGCHGKCSDYMEADEKRKKQRDESFRRVQVEIMFRRK